MLTCVDTDIFSSAIDVANAKSSAAAMKETTRVAKTAAIPAMERLVGFFEYVLSSSVIEEYGHC